MNRLSKHSLWERWADFTTCHDRTILGVVLFITVFFSYFLYQLEIRSELKDFHRQDLTKLNDTIEDRFKEKGLLGIIFESQTNQSLFSPQLLHEQLRFMQALNENYNVTTYSLVEGFDEGLQRVKKKSLLDVDEYSPIAEAILALSGPRTVRDLQRVSQNYLSHPEAISFYTKFRIALRFSGMGAVTKTEFSIPYVKAINANLQFDSGYTLKERRESAISMRELADSLATPEMKIYLYSTDLASHDIDIHTQRNAGLMGLILVIVDSLLLWGIFRSKREVFLTMFIVLTAAIWTYGAAGIFGVKISFLHSIALPILLGTGIDDSVVFGRQLAEEGARQKAFPAVLRAAFAKTGKAIFLTTFTTFVAFFISALVTTSPAVRSFSLLVSLSMVIVFLLTILLQGAIRSIVTRKADAFASQASADKRVALTGAHRPATAHPIANTLFGGLAVLSARWITRRPRAILLVSGFLFLAALATALNLETDFDRRLFMRKNMPSYVADQLEEKYFGRRIYSYILIEGDVANPLVLKKMRLLEERMNQHGLIRKVLGKADVASINELIDKMRLRIGTKRSMREIFDRLTNSEMTANYVSNESYREVSEHLVHKNGVRYDSLLMKFLIEDTEAKEIWALYDSLEEDIQRLRFDEIQGIKVRIGGSDLSYILTQREHFRFFIQTFFLSLLSSFLVLVFVWRKVREPLLAVIPLCVAVAIVVGLMALFGVKLNTVNLTVGSILVGLGIDYPIHIIERFNEERRGGVTSPLQAATTVLSSMGPALFASALTTIVGFSAACVFAIPIAQSFGIFTGIAILLAYLASIFVLPVLLVGRR